MALFYEDWEPGTEWGLGARTISEADVRGFAELSGDRNPLHLDAGYAAGTMFGRPIAQGLLGVAVASGLLNQARLTAGTLVAFVGLEWSFRRPIYPGDTVHLRVRVDGKRASRVAGRGLVRLGLELQSGGVVVQEGTFTLLVRGRDRSAEGDPREPAPADDAGGAEPAV